MNLLVKTAVGSALALAAMGANALGIPSTGSSDLVLVIQSNSNAANVYVLDTGIALSTAMAGTLVTGATLNTSLAGVNQTITASGALNTFLQSNPLSGDSWTIEGGTYAGGSTSAPVANSNTKNPGKAFGVFTSVAPQATVGGLQLTPFQGFLTGIQADIAAPGDGLGLNPLVSCGALCDATTGVSYQQAALGTPAWSKYGLFGIPNDDRTPTIGSAVALYGMTGNGTTGQLQTYILGTATLATNGDLILTGNGSGAPVPLPAAVWLFGSGLMGLVGVSRRRKAAAAA
jgi:hypothetical protein